MLGGLELLRARYETRTFGKHSHEGFTIGVIEQGAQSFYRTGGQHIAPAGTVILVNADEVHDGHAQTHGGWAYQALYPLPDQLAQLTESLTQGRMSTPYFPQPVAYDPQLAHALRLAMNASSDEYCSRLQRETLMADALQQLIVRHGRHRPPVAQTPRAQRQVEQVKSFLDEHPTADLSLHELAQMASLSPYHMARAFKRQYGLPPHAYQIQVRLRRARQLLRLGLAATQVAHDCGFHDQSHLHRHFVRAMGTTPGQYQSCLTA
ncbi:AraC family transcriptional regulator [Bacterioplanes sanyensis]|uniref:AraC family transcriptional regulator n=2 Tax=Bacterioplanes sanyensis TaxID=1249553 RepID=A0A222FP98_9GAMM|nr:AraC family transcriptional regulator [Bacterioplanes sanyensis]